MAKLPVTVQSLTGPDAGLYRVTVAFSDGTTGNYLIPETMATIQAVTVSAQVIAMLSDPAVAQLTHPHHKHRRYSPR